MTENVEFKIQQNTFILRQPLPKGGGCYYYFERTIFLKLDMQPFPPLHFNLAPTEGRKATHLVNEQQFWAAHYVTTT